MRLKTLSDEKLQTRLERLVRHERKVMTLVIEHIAEVMKRKLYLKFGYDGPYKYLTQKLGYSENCAYRRMWAAQALMEVPEIKSSLAQGSLNLSQICLVQKTLRQEEKVSREKVRIEKRKEIFEQIRGKTAKESEKILDAQVSAPLPKQLVHERHRRDDSVELTLKISKEIYVKLRKVKELYSHVEPGADWVKILDLMTDDVIKKRDPLAKKKTQGFLKSQKPSGEKKKRQPIPMEVRRSILRRDQGQCQYVASDGRKCGSRHQLELDHVVPVHQGGSNDPRNLRVFCRQHNAFRCQNIESFSS